MDYRNRLIEEYIELNEKALKLALMLRRHERGELDFALDCPSELDFVLDCPSELLRDQYMAMLAYSNVLMQRIEMEVMPRCITTPPEH